MTTSIKATNTVRGTDVLFTKLDAKQKGYIDEANLKSAADASVTDATKTTAVFKQLHCASDGKVINSALSTAFEKIGNEVSARIDQSRVNKAAGAAAECTGGPPPGCSAPPAKRASSELDSTSMYVAAEDTNTAGSVSAEEAAAYKRLLASAAEAKAQTQVQEYQKTSEMSKQTDSGSFAVSA